MVSGLVLAGGRSSRFGSDKGLFPYQGKPLVQHALDILQPVFPDLRISTNNPAAYAFLGLPIITDVVQGCGPVGGIYSALLETGRSVQDPSVTRSTIPAISATTMAVLSCDMPKVPPALFSLLLEKLGAYEAVVPVHGKYRETTCAIYTAACLPALKKAIQENRFRILDALESVHVLYLDVSSAAFYTPEIFHNINYREDI